MLMVLVSRVLNVTTAACLPMLSLLQMLLIINLGVASGKTPTFNHRMPPSHTSFKCFWHRECNNAQWMPSLGQCLPCKSLPTLQQCRIDSVPSQCDNGNYYCMQCHTNVATLAALLPFQVWQASSTAWPYTTTRLPYCTPVCAPGKTSI